MSFLVLMVVWRGDVEIAHHVARGPARLGRVAAGSQMRDEPGQQRQAVAKPIVARLEHLERFMQARGDRPVAGGLVKYGIHRVAIVRANLHRAAHRS